MCCSSFWVFFFYFFCFCLKNDEKEQRSEYTCFDLPYQLLQLACIASSLILAVLANYRHASCIRCAGHSHQGVRTFLNLIYAFRKLPKKTNPSLIYWISYICTVYVYMMHWNSKTNKFNHFSAAFCCSCSCFYRSTCVFFIHLVLSKRRRKIATEGKKTKWKTT